MEQEVIYRIALSRLKGINKDLAQHIHETVESLETFFELPEAQLQKMTGIKGRIQMCIRDSPIINNIKAHTDMFINTPTAMPTKVPLKPYNPFCILFKLTPPPQFSWEGRRIIYSISIQNISSLPSSPIWIAELVDTNLDIFTACLLYTSRCV